ncbi:hypothetical protein MFIFM68171_06560 [Madurella fahalii]|uniref:Uncharacterized protein n=1 Tax=Madurella fahalii TaxID=1157608 RepID=A0ABQ0GFM7_9PEZI
MSRDNVAPLTASEMSDLVVTGRALYAQFLRNLERCSNQYQMLPELAPYYDVSLDPPHAPVIGPRIEKALAEDGHLGDDYVFAEVVNINLPGRSEANGRPYQNYVDANGKALLCISNFADRDRLFGRQERIFWSDLMALCCAKVMATHGGNMRGLQSIWRLTIANEFTQRVIKTICGDRMIPIEFDTGNTQFLALLTTIHGKGPGRMLSTYPDIFGRRLMSRVRVLPPDKEMSLPDLCWILEEVPELERLVAQPPPPDLDSPMSRKERRKHKRLLSRSSVPSVSSD